jgi:hypothetical protein
MPLQDIQKAFGILGLFKGQSSGRSDPYTREAVLSFQRMWDMPQNGFVDDKLSRVLAFITADIQIT